MACLKPLIWLTAAVLACLVCAKDGDKLKAVVVLFRHGDRSPLHSWPNDDYFGNSSLWPDGYGQLNNLGKTRHYRLGQWFRQRYDGFLPKSYNRSDIYVWSTDVDRTLMSAASNLAGLFPPEGDQVWNDRIPWQAIPIHTIPEKQDAILAAKMPCPRYDWLMKQLKKSEDFLMWNYTLQAVFKNISHVTGFPEEEVDIKTLSRMYSTITIYREFNFSLPQWTEDYFSVLEDVAIKEKLLDTYTLEMVQLKTGPFFDYLLNYFDAIKNQTLLPKEHVKGPNYDSAKAADSLLPKFLMLSAHDGTICDRTNAMSVFPGIMPEFGATVIWEMKDGENGAYINMYYKDSTGLSELKMPECSFDCKLEDFARILQHKRVRLDEWTGLCLEK